MTTNYSKTHTLQIIYIRNKEKYLKLLFNNSSIKINCIKDSKTKGYKSLQIPTPNLASITITQRNKTTIFPI